MWWCRMSFFGFGNKTMKQKDIIAALEAEKERLQRCDEESKVRISELEDNATELQQSLNRLTIENKELKLKLNTEEPYEKVFNERQDLVQNISIMNSTIKELENNIHELTGKVERINAENISLQSKVATFRTTNNTVSGELQRELSKVCNLIRKRDELENNLEGMDKDKQMLQTELDKCLTDFKALQDEHADFKKEAKETEDKEESKHKSMITNMTVEMSEFRRKVENLQLETEALKSENEALFKANESKSGDIIQFRKEMTEIKNDMLQEKEKYTKIQQEWEERERTEFVMVSKTPTLRKRSRTQKSIREDDSEDEHVISVTESARAEADALRNKELDYKRRISQLRTDKEELFRSGTNLFVENKSIKARYEDLLNERQTLLKSETPLKRKVREQQEEIMKLKKTIDDIYYQNTAMQLQDEESARQKAYVVVMGETMVKQLEGEKSALIRRVKFLERENNAIESRVNELERQSADLIKYTQKYDKHSTFPAIVSRSEGDRPQYPRSPDTGQTYYSDDQMAVQRRPYTDYTGDRRTTPQRRKRTPDYLKGAKPRNYSSAPAKVDLPMLRSQQSHGTSRTSVNRDGSGVRSYNQSPRPPTPADHDRQSPPRHTPYSNTSCR